MAEFDRRLVDWERSKAAAKAVLASCWETHARVRALLDAQKNAQNTANAAEAYLAQDQPKNPQGAAAAGNAGPPTVGAPAQPTTASSSALPAAPKPSAAPAVPQATVSALHSSANKATADAAPPPPPPPPPAGMLRATCASQPVSPANPSAGAPAPPPPPPPPPAGVLRVTSALPSSKETDSASQLVRPVKVHAGAPAAPPPPPPASMLRAASACQAPSAASSSAPSQPISPMKVAIGARAPPPPPPPPPPASVLRSSNPPAPPALPPARLPTACTTYTSSHFSRPAPPPPPPPPPPSAAGLQRLSQQACPGSPGGLLGSALAAAAAGRAGGRPHVPPLKLPVSEDDACYQASSGGDCSSGPSSCAGSSSGEAEPNSSSDPCSSSNGSSAASSSQSSPRERLLRMQCAVAFVGSESPSAHRLGSAGVMGVLASATPSGTRHASLLREVPSPACSEHSTPHRLSGCRSAQVLASATSPPLRRAFSACGDGPESADRQLRRCSTDKRTLHWEGVRRAPQQLQGTVWGHVTDDVGVKQGVIDRLFSREVAVGPDGTPVKTPSRKGSIDGGNSPRNRASIIDIKRATAVEMVLKRFAMTPAAVVASIEGLNADMMPAETLQSLRQILPTSSEIQMVQAHYGPQQGERQQQLPQVDEFFLAMGSVKWLTEKIQAMEFRYALQETEGALHEFVGDVSQALSELMRSPRLRILLGAVRSAGNTVNDHRPNLQVQGIKISALKRLKDTKSFLHSDACLLHYLVADIEREIPTALDAANELGALRGMCRMDFGAAQAKVRALEASLDDIRKTLSKLQRPEQQGKGHTAGGAAGSAKAGGPGKVVAAAGVAELFAKRAAATVAGTASKGHAAGVVGGSKMASSTPDGAGGGGDSPAAGPAQESADAQAQVYLSGLAQFVEDAAPAVTALDRTLQKIMRQFRCVATYFCEDVSKGFDQQPVGFFSDFANFLDDLAKARSERRQVDRVHELMDEEERQARRAQGLDRQYDTEDDDDKMGMDDDTDCMGDDQQQHEEQGVDTEQDYVESDEVQADEEEVEQQLQQQQILGQEELWSTDDEDTDTQQGRDQATDAGDTTSACVALLFR